MVTTTALRGIAPFFIVRNLQNSIAFYQSLGFEIEYTGGGDGKDPSTDFFGMVYRDNVMIMLKAITPEVQPQPNSSRHPWAAWDAYVVTPDPDALFAEFVGRAVPIYKPLAD